MGGENSAVMRELSKATRAKEEMKKSVESSKSSVAQLEKSFAAEKASLLKQISSKVRAE